MYIEDKYGSTSCYIGFVYQVNVFLPKLQRKILKNRPEIKNSIWIYHLETYLSLLAIWIVHESLGYSLQPMLKAFLPNWILVFEQVLKQTNSVEDLRNSPWIYHNKSLL